ncbi:MAG TPA: BlaI/MecI/CopY family transcriptional regulator [Acidobacteriota bacterium]|nr:BlaI/MecI/CopY family transcriptional regulator [Acidobacteriota bacterium]
MKGKRKGHLSRREGQIMEAVYRLGEATVADIAGQIPEEIGTSSISKFLWLLEEKGLVTHRRSGKRNVYRPALPPEKASEKPLRNLMKTFFQGSASMTVVALLNQSRNKLSEGEIDELFDLIKQFKEKGK